MRRTLIALLACCPVGALAQPAPPPSGLTVTVPLQPAETDTIGCRFLSWTLTGAGTVTIAAIEPLGRPDATPADMIVAGPTLSNGKVSVQLHPDEDCASPGCRNGNSYQVTIQAEAAGGDEPICDFRVNVARVQFR